MSPLEALSASFSAIAASQSTGWLPAVGHSLCVGLSALLGPGALAGAAACSVAGGAVVGATSVLRAAIPSFVPEAAKLLMYSASSILFAHALANHYVNPVLHGPLGVLLWVLWDARAAWHHVAMLPPPPPPSFDPSQLARVTARLEALAERMEARLALAERMEARLAEAEAAAVERQSRIDRLRSYSNKVCRAADPPHTGVVSRMPPRGLSAPQWRVPLHQL